MRAVTSIAMIEVLSFLFMACRHVEPRPAPPEKRSTEAEIRRHIVGDWTAKDDSDDFWYPTMIFSEDGTLFGALTDGTKELIGTWEMSHSCLRITPSPARFEAARAAGNRLNEWDYYPVIYADEHELVMTPGISVAGRWRFKKQH